jgi:hypothetical protein
MAMEANTMKIITPIWRGDAVGLVSEVEVAIPLLIPHGTRIAEEGISKPRGQIVDSL